MPLDHIGQAKTPTLYIQFFQGLMWTLLNSYGQISVSFTAATGVRIPYGTPSNFNALWAFFISVYDPYCQFTVYSSRTERDTAGSNRAHLGAAAK
jgi:hypothetical protein